MRLLTEIEPRRQSERERERESEECGEGCVRLPPDQRNGISREISCVEVKEAQCWRIPRPPPPEQAGWVDRFLLPLFPLFQHSGDTSGEFARSGRAKETGDVGVFLSRRKIPADSSGDHRLPMTTTMMMMMTVTRHQWRDGRECGDDGVSE